MKEMYEHTHTYLCVCVGVQVFCIAHSCFEIVLVCIQVAQTNKQSRKRDQNILILNNVGVFSASLRNTQ